MKYQTLKFPQWLLSLTICNKQTNKKTSSIYILINNGRKKERKTISWTNKQKSASAERVHVVYLSERAISLNDMCRKKEGLSWRRRTCTNFLSSLCNQEGGGEGGGGEGEALLPPLFSPPPFLTPSAPSLPSSSFPPSHLTSHLELLSRKVLN